jgi:UDP-glucose 4-epimerase
MGSVLVTGGAGFLGSHLVRALAQRGTSVVAYDNGLTGTPRNLADLAGKIAVVDGDVTDLGHLSRTIQQHQVDRIIHGAAVSSMLPSLQDPALAVRVNVAGSVNVLEAMRLFPIERCLHISSEEAYGEARAEPIAEDQPLDPLTPYGVTKAAVEHLGRAYRRFFGTRIFHVRTSYVYGAGLPRPRPPRTFIEDALAGRPTVLPRGADQRADHTYIRDFVAGTLALLDCPDPRHEAYNIASGRSVTLEELAALTRELIPGARIELGPGPLEYAPGIPYPRKVALDIRRARNDFGYAPQYDLPRGLAEYIAWFRRGQPPTEL